MIDQAPNPILFTYELDVSSTKPSQLKDDLGNLIENQDDIPNTVFHFLLVHKNGDVNSRAEYILIMRPKPKPNSTRKEYLERVGVAENQILETDVKTPILKIVNSKLMLSLSNVKEPETVSVFGTRILRH